MRLFLCLFVLLAAGIALLALPEPWLNLNAPAGPGLYSWWHFSTSTFAVPLALNVLRMTRRTIVHLACLLWGLWLTALSLPLMFQSGTRIPQATPYGLLFVALVLVTSLALVLFSTMRLSRKTTQK